MRIGFAKQTAEPAGELKRVVGVSGLTFTIVNFVIGAGIFALPAVVGIQLGSFAIVAYVFCGIMIAAIMFCYAEIGSKITTTGGNYAYVRAAFGELPAYIVNWLSLLAWGLLADAAVINIFADSLAVLFPVFTQPLMRAVLFLFSISFMVIINIIGAKAGVTVVKWITVIKLVPLLGIIVFGFSHIRPVNLYWDHLPQIKTFGNSILVLFFAFCGFESALSIGGELKSPKRTVPLAILFGGLFVVIFYLLIQIVTQGVLGSQIVASKNAPLAAVAGQIIGPAGSVLLLVAAAISCFGNVFGDLLSSPRMLFAGAQDGLFPKFLTRTSLRFATPKAAIITYGILIYAISISGSFEQLAVLASAAILLIYLAVVLATVKLRRSKVAATEKPFRMPFGLLFPTIAVISICWLLSNLTRSEMLSSLFFIAFVIAVYLISKKTTKRRRLPPPNVGLEVVAGS